MTLNEFKILAEKLGKSAWHSAPKRALIAVSILFALPFFGLLTAFGVSSDTKLDSIPRSEIVQALALPALETEEVADEEFRASERILRGDTVAEIQRSARLDSAARQGYLPYLRKIYTGLTPLEATEGLALFQLTQDLADSINRPSPTGTTQAADVALEEALLASRTLRLAGRTPIATINAAGRVTGNIADLSLAEASYVGGLVRSGQTVDLIRVTNASGTQSIEIFANGLPTGRAVAGAVSRPALPNLLGTLNGARPTVGPGQLIGDLSTVQNPHEVDFIRELIGQGRRVELIPTSNVNGVRTADVFLDGVRIEIKQVANIRLNNPSNPIVVSNDISSSISRTILSARGQSGDIIIDARTQPGINDAIARRSIDRALGNPASRNIRTIQIITPNGVIKYPR